MKGFLSHLFYPQYSNNHRPKILHLSSIFIIIAFLFFSSIVIPSFRNTDTKVLGVSSSISLQELLLLTNQERQKQNIAPLVIDQKLSEAARNKANDMFANNYWAHISPTGKTPWDFVKESGYDYVYAGENLARGFSSSSDVVDAWIASPEHRSNMLSRNFQDVGFAVEEGTLGGEDTILIVEELGGHKITVPQGNTGTLSSSDTENNSSSANPPVQQNISPLIINKNMSINFIEIILAIFIGTLILDFIIVERKKIERVVGHNMDHIFFLTVIFICTVIIGKGIIL
jgi:hypothetical protein